MQERRQSPRVEPRRTAVDPTSIRACCPDCGDVRFSADLLTVHVHASGAAHVSYPCPRCRRRTAHGIPAAVAETLRRAGVAVRGLAHPAEADEVHSGAPINDDDVATFVAGLAVPDWQAELSR